MSSNVVPQMFVDQSARLNSAKPDTNMWEVWGSPDARYVGLRHSRPTKAPPSRSPFPPLRPSPLLCICSHQDRRRLYTTPAPAQFLSDHHCSSQASCTSLSLHPRIRPQPRYHCPLPTPSMADTTPGQMSLRSFFFTFSLFNMKQARC